MTKRIWVCLSPETYYLLKQQATEKGFSTRTKYLLYMLDKYEGEDLLRDRKYNNKYRKMTSMDVSINGEEMIERKAKMANLKRSDFIRSLAFTSVRNQFIEKQGNEENISKLVE